MTRLVGRAPLVEAVLTHLDSGRAVALHGPSGIGKTALLDELEECASRTGVRVLRATGALTESALAYAAVQDLLDQTPSSLLDQVLPPAERSGVLGADPADAARISRAWLAVLGRLADDGSVLVLVDDVQWLDEPSAAALQYAGRRLAARVGFVVTIGPGGTPPSRVPGQVDLEVAPLESGDVVELLGAHGLAPHVAQRVAAESGGLPSLALALGGAVGELPAVLGRPSALPPSLERMLRDRVGAQPAEVRTTLLYAALMRRPTVRRLVRAGRVDAEAQLRIAAGAGLVVVREQAVRFTPPGLVDVITDRVDAATRAGLHRTLARTATDPEQRLRHEALAATGPDGQLATTLADAAGDAVRLGRRDLAAELFLLAADRAEVDQSAERVEWLASAAEIGALGNHADLVHRAADDFLGTDASPAQRVRVRLALVELAGTGPALLEEVLATALGDAAGDPALVAGVLLQKARVHLMESRPAEAGRNAAEAVRLLDRPEDQIELAVALPILAVTRRWLGAGDHDDVLRLALALPEPKLPGLQHTSPRYIAARFAFYDDRLEEAWNEQLAILATLDLGAGADLVHVLRCLVETGARLGRAREAMTYAARAAVAAADFDLDAHTGWYVSAVAELVGGDLSRGLTLAERGIAACDQHGDTRYLQRHLVVHGQAALRSGDARRAVRSLERVRVLELEHGISDPTVNRWQAELVSALVAVGDLDRAAEVLDEARKSVVGRSGTEGVVAQLDRAEAEVLVALGDASTAAELLDRAETTTRALGMRIDLGRTLLTRAHLERRRRRVAAARSALEAAYALFTELQARPWAAQAAEELGATSRAVAVPADLQALVGRLTETEVRIARAVADGASNKEIAERLFLSVKTVEATLTRIYRKLGIRSRTQLATLIHTP